MFNLDFIPDIHFFCAGSCEGRTELTSFDGALLKASIGNTNLIKMSSIVPPGSKEVAPFEIPPGSFLPLAYASITSAEPGETISAAVAIAVPDDPKLNGVIMEHSNHASLNFVDKKVRAMAAEAMEMRGIDKFTLKSKGVETEVKRFATAFSAVVLWHSSALSSC